ncbi:MAG: FAD-dependent monooxygenase [Thermomicrobiales bacterium]|nr:FAD-dependent monooxygenase [Thermomicrobiales bacterium]
MCAANPTNDVLIVGAGPTGLTLGIELARRDVPFLLIERDVVPPATSRAIGLQTRTAEMLRLLGIPRSALTPSLQPRALCLEEGRRTLACIAFDAANKDGVTLTVIDETDTERILTARLEALGGAVLRGTELVSWRGDGDGVAATIRDTTGEREVRARYLVGADGAHSLVRRMAGIPFEGTAYAEQFILADLDIDWDLPHDIAHVWIGGDHIAAVLPLPGARRYRTILPLAKNVEIPASATEAQIGARAIQVLRERTGLPLQVQGTPIWASAFRISRRQAARYRKGPVFLAGDAAHVHSPVGGQGMNTGIQDACNLGWKLALAVRGQAAPGLLDTYHAERAPIAHDLLRNTDLATRAVLSQNDLMREVRRHLIPLLAKQPRVRQRLLPLLGQLNINYRGSFLAVDARSVRRQRSGLLAGDRVPDQAVQTVEGKPERLYDLVARGWTLLLFAGAEATPERLRALHDLAATSQSIAGDAVHVVLIAPASSDATAGAVTLLDAQQALATCFGASAGLAALIRPDGYLGYRGALEDAGAFASYLARVFAMRMVG